MYRQIFNGVRDRAAGWAGCIAIAVAATLYPVAVAAEQSASPAVAIAEKHLYAGTLADGVAELTSHIETDPADETARLARGGILFVQAIEGLGRNFYRHGLEAPRTVMVPLFRLPVPSNPEPEPLGYDGLRDILARFVVDLARAEADLAHVGPGAKLPIRLARIRLDLNSDGIASEAETFWTLFKVLVPQLEASPEEADAFMLAFDTGDAAWLSGYGHVLSAFAEFLLAHDFRASFDHGFHLFFPSADTPFNALLKTAGSGSIITPDDAAIADVLALFHTINWPVAEPERMRAAQSHLLTVFSRSRQSWQAIRAETDDDHEWLPNPRQTGIFPNLTVTDERIDGWLAVLSEAEAILTGRKLVPHWRFTSRGIDANRFFNAPERFDLMLMITGTGAIPYLAEGDITSQRTWSALTRIFERQFLSFVVWFN